MAFQLFPLLCGLATVSFTAFANSWQHVLCWIIGLLLLLLLTVPLIGQSAGLLQVEPAQLATVVSLAALLKLQNDELRSAAVMFGGALAAIWIDALGMSGYPWSLASLSVVFIALFTLACAIYRKEFVTGEYLNEALIIVLVMALLISVLPAAIAGWQSAANLQGLDTSQDGSSPNAGLFLLITVFTVLGGLYARWKYK